MPIKTIFTIAATTCVVASVSAQAQDLAAVVSTVPLLEQVRTPVSVCTQRDVSVQGEKSGGGALIGAIAGGAMGNAVGQGSGRALATAVGIMGGAILGDRIEGEPANTTQTVQDCHQEYRTDTRVRAYRVTYEYAGKRYEIEMAQDPGSHIPVQVVPNGLAAPTQPRLMSQTTVVTTTSPVRVVSGSPIYREERRGRHSRYYYY